MVQTVHDWKTKVVFFCTLQSQYSRCLCTFTSAYTLARLPVAIDAPQRRRAAEALSEAQIAPL